MLNLERINAVVIELEKTSQGLKNVANISAAMEDSIKTFDTAISEFKECYTSLDTYTEKAKMLESTIDNLVGKLQDIRTDYHKVSTSVEIVEGDLRNFTNKLDLITNNLTDLKKDIAQSIRAEIAGIKKQSRLLGGIAIGLGIISVALLIILLLK